MKWLMALLLFCAASTGPVAAQNWPQGTPYSADLLVGRDHPREGKMWRSALGYRQELSGQAIVLRFDRNLAWVLAGKSFLVEIDFASTGMALSEILSGRDLHPQAEGHDVVNGMETTRYKVHFNHDPVSHFAGQVWATKDGIIMRITGEGSFGGQSGRVDIEARNVQRGPQPDNLFDAPQASARIKVDAATAAQVLMGLGAMK